MSGELAKRKYLEASLRMLKARVKREQGGRSSSPALVEREARLQYLVGVLWAWEDAATAFGDRELMRLYSMALAHWTRKAAEADLPLYDGPPYHRTYDEAVAAIHAYAAEWGAALEDEG